MKLKKTGLIAIIGIGALAAYFLWSWQHNRDSKINYREVKAVKGAIETKVLATGTVQPENRLEIKPPIPGRVEQVLVKEGQKVQRGQILAWMSSIERAALLDAARSKGAQELKKWQEIYPPTPILAPINGTIVLKNVEQGQTFTSADSLLSMSDRLTVKAQVDETDIALIKVKQKATIILDAYPDSEIPALVDKIAFDATTVNNVTTYIVDALPQTVPEFMRSGMTANVTFLIDAKNDIVVVPSESLKNKDGRWVILTGSAKNPQEKTVEIGATDGKQIEILSGLNEGETILLAPLNIPQKNNSASPFSPMGRSQVRKSPSQ